MRPFRAMIALVAGLCLTLSGTQAATFTMEDGAVRFDAPVGFKPLSRKLIETKFARGRPPSFVVGTERATTTIAYDLKGTAVAPNQLTAFRKRLTKVLPRIVAGLKWIENKTIKIDGRDFGLMEMTSTAIDTDIHNIMLFTSYKGQLLIFNFNSTREEFPQYEAQLRESIETIRIGKPVEPADAQTAGGSAAAEPVTSSGEDTGRGVEADTTSGATAAQ